MTTTIAWRSAALVALALATLCAGSGAAAPDTAGSPAPPSQGDVRVAARRALERYGPAVVTVRVVLKRRLIAQGRERGSAESQLEVAGTTLTATGLTVVSDVTTNPAALSASDDDDTRLDTETTDVKILLRDGRELPARFVLRDADLDLAFLVPEEAGLKLPFLDLSSDTAAVPEALDDLIYLYPLARSLGRETGVVLDRVRGVSRKPRTFVASEIVLGMQSLGCPVFDGAGRALGLSVMRRAPRTSTAGGGFRDVFDAFTPVVVTAADVQGVARQALERAATSPAAKPAPGTR